MPITNVTNCKAFRKIEAENTDHLDACDDTIADWVALRG